MKLNCDMGESFGSWQKGMDAEVMPYIDMANIACGFHASDPMTMDLTVAMAKEYDVVIGAHPGYPDLLGFGRRTMQCSPQELKTLLIYQIAALDGICRTHSTRLSYVKPHGALYNQMMKDSEVLATVMAAIHAYDRELALVVLANGNRDKTQHLADQQGIALLFEAFADRAYDSNGYLAKRDQPGAVFNDIEQIEQQVLGIIHEGKVSTLDGGEIPLNADTICVHGDNAQAVAAVRHIRQTLAVSLIPPLTLQAQQ
ncbi:5-oxoprolinase subunit PxpA [Endozoicomonas sp. SM1973]|uniref:5-oxoprolinase subunit A n=1 Tax=Spartinivicinus marinus TaxID=2994442 RepID=A0A853I5F2_9GAMM|nr:5-oxoprolinase subunit PxpA [Spartinivicinus marinus]MCX4029173.1 5-oxoprolinase subunit PxpA [Spartinivicinus marinus]NYZ65918.1 5-oxoprolinase subunit PxpA [Spartinivicinus marinus]